MEHKSPLNLIYLPEDILLTISVHLHVTDILSLKQTCRVLHAFGCSDYLWHLIVPLFDLPLDIGPDVPLNALSGKELRVLAVKAIKLERTWTEPEPQIKKITCVIHGTDDMYVDAMTLLPGAKWLVTAQRGKSGSRITLWSLHNLEDVRRAATLHFPRCLDSYGTGMHQDGSATLSVSMLVDNQKVLKVYALSLPDYMKNEHIFPATPRLIATFTRPRTQGIMHALSICNSVIVATLVHWPHNGSLGPSFSLLFLNLGTGVTRVVDHPLPENTSDVGVYLYPKHVAITSIINQERAFVHVYCLPPSILQPGRAPDSAIHASESLGTHQTDSLGTLITQYCFSLPGSHDYRISGGLHHPSTFHLSSFAHPGSDESIRNRNIYLYHLYVNLPRAEHASCPSIPIDIVPTVFPGNSGTSAPVVCVGITGRRAVWQEHDWEREETRLMRLSYTSIGSVAGVLVPSHPALPFTPAACHSLAFDEVTGRLCVGLETGELYILDY